MLQPLLGALVKAQQAQYLATLSALLLSHVLGSVRRNDTEPDFSRDLECSLILMISYDRGFTNILRVLFAVAGHTQPRYSRRESR